MRDRAHASVLSPPATRRNQRRRAIVQLTTAPRVAPPLRAVATASSTLRARAAECASELRTSETPAASASRTCTADRSSRSGRPFTSTATPVSSATAKTSSRSSAFSGRWFEDPALRMAQRPHRGMPHRLGHHPRELVAAAPLARVQAQLHPLERLEHAVVDVERAVGADVALDAAQHPERSDALVHLRDLLRLAEERVRVEARDDAHVRAVVADREVLVAAIASRERHLVHRVPAVRPRRVAVEVAADVCRRSTRSGGASAPGSSRSSGGQYGSPSQLEQLGLGRRVRAEAPSACDVLGRPGRAHELGAVRRRARNHDASPARRRRSARRHADRSRSSTTTIAGSAAKRSSTLGVVGGHDDDELVRQLGVATRRPGDLAAECVRDLRGQRAAAIDRQARAARPAPARGSRRSSPR